MWSNAASAREVRAGRALLCIALAWLSPGVVGAQTVEPPPSESPGESSREPSNEASGETSTPPPSEGTPIDETSGAPRDPGMPPGVDDLPAPEEISEPPPPADAPPPDEDEPTEAASDESDRDEQEGAASSSSTDDDESKGGGEGGGFLSRLIPPRLPFNLELHGNFDVAYEKRDFTDDPTKGKDNLTSYHHFLFLTRRAKDDPIGLNVELVNQLFYEISARFTFDEGRWTLLARGGKILVPFGGDPLFHHSYGGLAGFDNKVLPVVWSRHGLAVQGQVRLGPVQISDEVYVVEGYRLKAPDGVLNLQSDLASNPTQLGVGNRLGISFGPLTGWYSYYFNQIGFGRRLSMHAIDLSLWRWPGVPVLEDIVIRVGIMRADVFGGDNKGYGGPGLDYYHFAHYLELRYYPLNWVYLQYRTGLRTFDNRRGWFADTTRFDELDGTSHNLGVVATWAGLRVGFYWFWNLEKNNEQDNDFLRLVVGYVF